MDIALAVTTLALVLLTLLVSIYFGVRGVRAGERGAKASERATVASEEALEIVKEDKATAEERQRPRVDVQILQVWPLSTDASGDDVNMRVAIENRSTEPETLRSLTVQFNDHTFTCPSQEGRHVLKQYTTEPAAPQTLPPGMPVELRLGFRTEPLKPTPEAPLRAVLIAECSSAGEVTEEFLVYPPVNRPDVG